MDEKDGGEDHTVRMQLRAGGRGVPVGRRGPSYGMRRGGNEGKWREGMERIVRYGLGDRRLSGNESWGLRLGSPRREGSRLRDEGMRGCRDAGTRRERMEERVLGSRV